MSVYVILCLLIGVYTRTCIVVHSRTCECTLIDVLMLSEESHFTINTIIKLHATITQKNTIKRVTLSHKNTILVKLYYLDLNEYKIGTAPYWLTYASHVMNKDGYDWFTAVANNPVMNC